VTWTDSAVIAFLSTLFCIIGVISVELIAVELEDPFGNDANDLPVLDFQEVMNRSLLMLLNPTASQYPHLTDMAIRNFTDFHKSPNCWNMTLSDLAQPLASSSCTPHSDSKEGSGQDDVVAHEHLSDHAAVCGGVQVGALKALQATRQATQSPAEVDSCEIAHTEAYQYFQVDTRQEPIDHEELLMSVVPMSPIASHASQPKPIPQMTRDVTESVLATNLLREQRDMQREQRDMQREQRDMQRALLKELKLLSQRFYSKICHPARLFPSSL